eukprot:118818-Pleurochrysis_carterae.AAC.1
MQIDESADEQCTYASITQCNKEGHSGKSLRCCYQHGSEGLHHHMCAVSEPRLEQASAVPDSTKILCSVCAGILTIAQVLTTCTDKDAHVAHRRRGRFTRLRFARARSMHHGIRGYSSIRSFDNNCTCST